MRGCSVRKGNKKRPAAGAGLFEVTLLYGLRTGRSGSGFVRGAMTASRTFTVKIKVRANPLALTRRFRYVVWRWGAGHRRRGVTIGDLNDRRSRDNRLSRNDRLRRWCRFNHRFGNNRRFLNNHRRLFNRNRFSDRSFRFDSLLRNDVNGFCDNFFGHGFIGFGNQLRLFINRGGDSLRMRGFYDRNFRFVNHRHRLGSGHWLDCAFCGDSRGNDVRDSRLSGSHWRDDGLSRSG